MVTTLSHRGNGDENIIDIYSNSPTSPHPPSDTITNPPSTFSSRPHSSITSHSPSTTTDHTSSSTSHPPSSTGTITAPHPTSGSPPSSNGDTTTPHLPSSTNTSHIPSNTNTTPQLPSNTTHPLPNTTITTHPPPTTTSNIPESVTENHLDSSKANKFWEEEEVSWERRRRDIVLRNMLMDMLLSLLSSARMQLNSRYVHETPVTIYIHAHIKIEAYCPHTYVHNPLYRC